MCILQINRINEYESQIKSLKQQIEELNRLYGPLTLISQDVKKASEEEAKN